ncbi:hypothetical protein B1790_31730 [Mycobacterium sp. AT1]|nr:hypothetical protein B1790_31730 [Mycobacterium sp. AT1]
MAWIRTCTSLIAFGFTIYQLFLYVNIEERLRAPVVSPQVFEVLMIVTGLTALALAWIRHRQQMRALRSDFGTMPYSIPGFIAGLGVVALLGVTLRL